MSIIYKGTPEEKCDLLYGFFDVDGDGYVSKEELMTIFFQFYQIMIRVKFKDKRLRELQSLCDNMPEVLLNNCIIEMVAEIFKHFSKKENCNLLIFLPSLSSFDLPDQLLLTYFDHLLSTL